MCSSGFAELTVERSSNIVQEALELAVITLLNPGRFRFAHPLIREALYQHPPAAERIRLHRRIGKTMEQLHRTDLEPHIGAHAHHFFNAVEGSDAGKAIDYLVRAGAAAFAVFATKRRYQPDKTGSDCFEEPGPMTIVPRSETTSPPWPSECASPSWSAQSNRSAS
jgi:predicted ATPase